MTMCAEQAPRSNSQGHPCPPWCTADHADHDGHSSRTVSVAVPGKIRGLPDSFLVYGWQQEGRELEVMIAALRYGRPSGQDPDMTLDLHRAERLAGLVEMLAGATPEQHRELAAAIRQAAALISGSTGAQR